MTIEKNNKIKYGLKELQKDRGTMTFARLLLSYRLSQGWTQQELARKISGLSLTRGNICDYEKGRKVPSPAYAEKIAKKLGEIPSYWLEVAIQDMLRKENLEYTINIKAAKAS